MMTISQAGEFSIFFSEQRAIATILDFLIFNILRIDGQEG